MKYDVEGRKDGTAKGQRRFADLLAWQRPFDLALAVYRITRRWPKEELYGLVSQVRRAAVSVPANVAEGYERGGKREFSHFLSIARGSLGEVETYILLAKELGYLSNKDYDALDSLRKEAAMLLRGLLNAMRKRN